MTAELSQTSAGRTIGGRWISAASAERDLGLFLPGDLGLLRRLGTAHHAKVGALIVAAGSTVEHVQVIAEGELELRARLPTGPATMALARTGSVIGDISLLLDTPMPFDAIASRDTECVRLSRERWTALLAASPDLALRWMASIARRLDDDRRRLVVVTSKPLVAQVAFLLLELAEEAPGGDRVVALSHLTMGHLLGARRQSVTRVVGSLKRSGLIDVRYGHTVIVDSEGLRRVMGSEPLP